MRNYSRYAKLVVSHEYAVAFGDKMMIAKAVSIWRESSAGRLVSIILVLILSGLSYSKLVNYPLFLVFQYVEVKATG